MIKINVFTRALNQCNKNVRVTENFYQKSKKFENRELKLRKTSSLCMSRM